LGPGREGEDGDWTSKHIGDPRRSGIGDPAKQHIGDPGENQVLIFWIRLRRMT